jgi:hypothetical protein
MGLFTPDEVVYNFGPLPNQKIKIEDVTYTITYAKPEKATRQLSVETSDGEVIPLNQDKVYEFPQLTHRNFKTPTKRKQKGKR